MKKIILICLVGITLIACNQSGKKQSDTKETPNAGATKIDASIVNVYYFHGKQRCKTCVAVGDIAKETVEKNYADNNKVQFIEVSTSEKANEALAEKYEVTWNALIITKGENSIDITDQAFATAVNNPQSLENLITEEVNKQLQ